MTGIYHRLLEELKKNRALVLTTLLSNKGSVPQVPGASALFSKGRLLAGTLGGGVLEGDATTRSASISQDHNSQLYEYDLDGDITSVEGAICGGSALLLMDADPKQNMEAFTQLNNSLSKGQPGILTTLIRGNDTLSIERHWFEQGQSGSETISERLKEFREDFAREIPDKMSSSLENNTCIYLEESESISVFLEPVFPLPKLYIAGAGHIGRALAHMGSLLDFEVTVIDDRPEYANPENIPDADHIIVSPIGKAIQKVPKTASTYIVIVTRGHQDDGEALKACIDADIPYIGMIGSKKKIALMRNIFLEQGWATEDQLKRVHAPVGLEIGSKTVQEIAVSISAQLVQVRNENKPAGKSHHIPAIILAAGESSRMGKPKMMLPFGEKSIIETVIMQSNMARSSKTYVVLGSGEDAIRNTIKDQDAEIVFNQEYKKGMLSSVQKGLKSLPETTEAVMVLLGDQPMIGTQIMDSMIARYKQTEKNIIIASYQGKRGHPILIGSGHFKKILGFSSDQSLRDLLDLYPEDIEDLETENPEILRDIDTQQDYQNELKQQRI